MNISSLGILAAAAFSLAASGTSYGNESAYGNGQPSSGGTYENGAHPHGGGYANGGSHDKGGAHGGSNGGKGSAYHYGGGKHANGGTHGNNGAYNNGGSSNYGGSSGGSYGNGGIARNGDHTGKGGAYGNGGASNGGAYPHDAHEKGASHLAVLSGGNEVSDDGKANVGDPEGRGTATVTVQPAAGKLCFAVIVSGIDTPVAAHVHHAQAGKNGPVVVPLTAPDGGDPGTASGCVSNIDATVLRAIKAQPWDYYINVHTGQYPNGAVRGQLF